MFMSARLNEILGWGWFCPFWEVSRLKNIGRRMWLCLQFLLQTSGCKGPGSGWSSLENNLLCVSSSFLAPSLSFPLCFAHSLSLTLDCVDSTVSVKRGLSFFRCVVGEITRKCCFRVTFAFMFLCGQYLRIDKIECVFQTNQRQNSSTTSVNYSQTCPDFPALRTFCWDVSPRAVLFSRNYGYPSLPPQLSKTNKDKVTHLEW